MLLNYSGWAHVGLHDAVLDGNIVLVKATLLRYMRKCPAKINELDVSTSTPRLLQTIYQVYFLRIHLSAAEAICALEWVNLCELFPIRTASKEATLPMDLVQYLAIMGNGAYYIGRRKEGRLCRSH